MVNKARKYKNSPYAELIACDISAKIRIYTYNQEYKYDSDWYMTHISSNMNGTHVEIDEPSFSGKELVYLLDELRGFRDLKNTHVDFSSEPSLKFKLSLDKNKKLETYVDVEGEMFDSTPTCSIAIIHFKFRMDFCAIDNFIAGIERILKEFPPKCKIL